MEPHRNRQAVGQTAPIHSIPSSVAPALEEELYKLRHYNTRSFEKEQSPLCGAATIENADSAAEIPIEKSPAFAGDLLESGGDLLSRAVTSQVPSALKGLTSVFGMGTGVTPSSLPPEMVNIFRQVRSVVLVFLFAYLLAPLCRRAHAYMG